MNIETTSSLPYTALEAWITRKYWNWSQLLLLVAIVLLLLPLVAGYLEGLFSKPLEFWRATLLAPVIIIYILTVQPLFRRFRSEAIAALRSLTTLDSEAFDHQVAAGMPKPQREWFAFALGALLCIGLLQPWRGAMDLVWMRTYRILATALMGGLTGSVIYVTLSSTRLLTQLHAQPLHIDIFNPVPLEPIARRSLFLALIFLGGTSLGLVLVPDQGTRGLIATSTIIALAIAIFFLGTYNTHRVMVGAKQRELATIRHNLAAVYTSVQTCIANQQLDDLGTLNTLTNLWMNYERRVKEAPEWPFNGTMVRQLLFSMLIPLIIVTTQRILVETILRAIPSK